MVVGVPCNLIFWHFWLFIDFRLVVTLLLVVKEVKGFYLMASILARTYFSILEVSINTASSSEILLSAMSSLLINPSKAFFILVQYFFF